jgi:anti-anti-sigma factor
MPFSHVEKLFEVANMVPVVSPLQWQSLSHAGMADALALSVQVTERESYLLLVFRGELKFDAMIAERRHLIDTLRTLNARPQNNHRAIILDMSACRFVDKHGLCLLMNLERAARNINVTVIFCGLSPHVNHALKITRLF